MSVYLGDTRVGAAFHKDRYNEVTPEQMEELNDAVNYRTGKFDTNSIPEMIEELKTKYMISMQEQLHINENPTPWVRPQGWPDLDSLNLQMEGDTDFIYMTYDATRTYGAVNLYITGSNIEVTMGHISSGAYVIDETISGSNNIYYKSLDGLGGYPIIRVTGSITVCQLRSITRDGRTQAIKEQPLLERIAYVPHIIQLSSGSSADWGSYYLEREKINNGDGDALTYLGYSYNNCYDLRSLDISGLKTQNVTSMTAMFRYCRGLNQALDLRHFDVSKVTTLENMFYDCKAITEINLTGWNPKLTSTSALNGLFYGCYSLKHIYGIKNFNTSNCTTFSCLFYDCRNLQELEDLSDWDTSNVTNLYYVFYNCMSIKNLDFVSSWNVTNKVTNLDGSFYGCRNIEKLDLHTWDVSGVTRIAALFYSCCSLKQLNITGWVINSIASLSNTFSYCSSLEELDISGWHVTNTCNNIYQCFYSCYSLKYLDIPEGWDLSGLSTNTSTSIADYIFGRCHSLRRITGISNWNLNCDRTALSVFSECWSLEKLDVSNWNVSRITNFSSMFSNCFSLKTLDISNWNTSSATVFNSMFNSCFSLTNLNLANWNTSKVTNFSSMFSYCYSLTTVGDISDWDTSQATTFANMFYMNHSLKTLPNLNNWDVSKVTTTVYMFRGCSALEEITINNWNLASCTTIQQMFQECHILKKLVANNWSLPKLSTAPTDLFSYCYSLTTYNGTIPISLNHNYNYCYPLTYESLINIFTNLPTVTTTRTIRVDSHALNQLTSTERAIATQNGWTITT